MLSWIPFSRKLSRDCAIGKDAGDHERPEEIALAAFVDAEMRLEHFRRMHFLITEPRFAENLRLQFETDEILDALALQEHLGSFFVNRDAQFILLGEKERVGLRRKIETGFLEQAPQRLDLLPRQQCGVGGEWSARHGSDSHEIIARPLRRGFLLICASRRLDRHRKNAGHERKSELPSDSQHQMFWLPSEKRANIIRGLANYTPIESPL